MMPLVFLQIGQNGVVKDMVGGKGIWQKLTRMGFARGATVRIVKNDGSGPLIIALGEGRLVLGQGMAQKVMVEEVS
jgi:ferrous iron transport protein A